MQRKIDIPPVFSVQELLNGKYQLVAEPNNRHAIVIPKGVLDKLMEYGICELFEPTVGTARRSGIYVRWARPYEVDAFFKKHNLTV